jgi:hypothetical protein
MKYFFDKYMESENPILEIIEIYMKQKKIHIIPF